jgi:hypothetical protein
MIKGMMNPRLAKEFRPLLLPWAAAVGGAALLIFLNQTPAIDQFGVLFFVDLAGYVFFGGLALVAAMAFGTEFQHRTLPLLLSQPARRARVWTEKMLVLGSALVAAALIGLGFVAFVSVTGISRTPLLNFGDLVLAGLFLLATTCSCGFWTLLAGSTIGGLVFTLVSQFILAMGLALAFAGIHGQDRLFEDPRFFPVLVIAGLAYSAVFLWLSRQRFIRLELRNSGFKGGVLASGSLGWRLPWSNLLVSQPHERALNLMRKELRLQKPIFQLAGAFTACWVATLLTQSLRPSQRISFLFDIVTCLYAHVSCLLAGCISLGEEKELGLTAPQLVLPYSLRLQWLIKLTVSGATALTLCIGLPWFLFWATRPIVDLSENGLVNPNDRGMEALSCISALTFLLGYWAISLTASTVRAALVAIFALVGLCVCVALGVWCGSQSSGLQTPLLISLMCQLQLPPDILQAHATGAAQFLGYVAVGGIILLSLRQSLIQFRRSEQQGHRLFNYSITLAGLVTGLSFWSVDLGSSLSQIPNLYPIVELKGALHSLARRDLQQSEQPARVVSPQELETRLSEQTKIWLRNAVVSYSFLRPDRFKNGDRTYQATVVFPDGRSFSFTGGYSNYLFRKRYGL